FPESLELVRGIQLSKGDDAAFLRFRENVFDGGAGQNRAGFIVPLQSGGRQRVEFEPVGRHPRLGRRRRGGTRGATRERRTDKPPEFLRGAPAGVTPCNGFRFLDLRGYVGKL